MSAGRGAHPRSFVGIRRPAVANLLPIGALLVLRVIVGGSRFVGVVIVIERVGVGVVRNDMIGLWTNIAVVQFGVVWLGGGKGVVTVSIGVSGNDVVIFVVDSGDVTASEGLTVVD